MYSFPFCFSYAPFCLCVFPPTPFSPLCWTAQAEGQASPLRSLPTTQCGWDSVVRETEFGYRIQGPPLQYLKYIEAIEAAKKEIPEQYIDDIMSHIMEKKRYKDIEGVSEKTLKKWVQKFIWHVAHNLGDV